VAECQFVADEQFHPNLSARESLVK